MNVTIYECKRCGYSTTYKSALLKHFDRKILCCPAKCDLSREELLAEYEKPSNEDKYKCQQCGKCFTSSQGKYQHKKHCKVDQKQMVDSLMTKVSELEAKLNNVTTGATNNIGQINTTNNIQQNIINVQLKDFGHENIKHIEENKAFLTNCLLQRDIKSLIEIIHCDKEYPENHTVRLKSLKYDLMETYVDGNWIITDKEETLDELVNKGYRVLRFHSHKNKKDILEECDDDENEYEDIVSWLESIYEDNKIRKPIRRQLLILFMNNKALLLGKDVDF